MRRFRVINPRFDTRARFLAQEIGADWEEHIKRGWEENQRKIVREVGLELGEVDLDGKIERLVELDAEPFSVVAYHNEFLRQCRYAYVQSAYYPALTGACALGERLLNHLVLDLREDFRSSPHYRKVYDKDSFDNWDRVLEVLGDWGVLTDESRAAFDDLKIRRNAAIHFDPATDHDARTLAREAIRSLQAVVEHQFGLGPNPWFIPDAPHTYVAGEAQEWPFVKHVILPSPSVAEVGPNARLEFDYESGAFVVAGVGDAGPDIGSDDEFLELVRRGEVGPACGSA
jgi:hypothetical protein